jgi:hypothetical protein
VLKRQDAEKTAICQVRGYLTYELHLGGALGEWDACANGRLDGSAQRRVPDTLAVGRRYAVGSIVADMEPWQLAIRASLP